MIPIPIQVLIALSPLILLLIFAICCGISDYLKKDLGMKHYFAVTGVIILGISMVGGMVFGLYQLAKPVPPEEIELDHTSYNRWINIGEKHPAIKAKFLEYTSDYFFSKAEENSLDELYDKIVKHEKIMEARIGKRIDEDSIINLGMGFLLDDDISAHIRYITDQKKKVEVLLRSRYGR